MASVGDGLSGERGRGCGRFPVGGDGFVAAREFYECRLRVVAAEELHAEGHAIAGDEAAGNDDGRETRVGAKAVTRIGGETTTTAGAAKTDFLNDSGAEGENERVEFVLVQELDHRGAEYVLLLVSGD